MSELELVDVDAEEYPGLVPCRFNLQHYGAILRLATDLGYRCLGCRDYLRNSSGKTLLLRHDVDLSLADAVTIAEIELANGARSTFFIRVGTQNYDVRSPNAAAHLRRLLAVGAELGLHYDVGRSHLDPQLVACALAQAREILEEAAGVRVRGGTMHMPRRAVMQPTRADKEAAGLTYDPGDREFNKDTKFLSDSRRSWSDGCLCRHLGRSPKLYTLIHPFWWCHPNVDERAVLHLLRSEVVLSTI